MILSAQTIRHRCFNGSMITPFHERTVSQGKTFGLGAAGYDVRVEFNVGNMVNFSAPIRYADGYSNSGRVFLLASTMERFIMPDNVMGIVHDKSSWARKGLTVQNTVIEPGWAGFLTLELAYHGESELTVCYGDPIAQIVFHLLDEVTEQPYRGKYQNQERGPQEAIEE